MTAGKQGKNRVGTGDRVRRFGVVVWIEIADYLDISEEKCNFAVEK